MSSTSTDGGDVPIVLVPIAWELSEGRARALFLANPLVDAA